ncbi:MAG: hypothetical protein IKF51_03560 [Solobacterium sp.]|jgi:hypothetical protein|nr:hypothetical protein [Solobacterium sp.]
MDALIHDLAIVSREILPILGALVLIFLCVLLKKCWALIDGLTGTVKNLDPTLRKVDDSIAKVQAPLDTVVKYSNTLNDVHDKVLDGFTRAAENAGDKSGKLKEYVTSHLTKEDSAEFDVFDGDEAGVLMDEPAEKEDGSHV